MSLLLHIADRALNRPLLIHPDKLPLILGVLEGRIPLGDISALREAARVNIDRLPEAARTTMLGPSPTASRFVGTQVDKAPDGRRTALPYKRTRDGVAIIPVIGSLVNRGAFIGPSSGVTSYEGLRFQIAYAVEDPQCSAILLDIDSPGGEVDGCFETTAAIRAASAVKPVIAVVNGMAASAAYSLASGAGRIITTETGISGSIGVVWLHADYSAKLKKDGISPTLIFAGAHKVDGNPFEALSKDVRADIQAEIDQFYDLLVQSVSLGRRQSETSIRATEARTYIGRKAIDAGLADELGTFETALACAAPRTIPPTPTAHRIAAAANPLRTTSGLVAALAARRSPQ